MLFTFLLSTAVCRSFGLRPEGTLHKASSSFSRLAEEVANAAVTTEGSQAANSLENAASIVNSIMLQAGNATEHMSDDDKALLNSVIDLIDKSIYGSMDSSHQTDTAAIQAALDAIDQCNADIAARLGEGGDLHKLQHGVVGYQHTLNDLQDDVDKKTQANNTKFAELQRHIGNIGAAPACDRFPAEPTKEKVDIFFDTSAYVNWYTAQQEAYAPFAEAFESADDALGDALTAYAVGLAERDVAYCDWKVELEEGCAAFDLCYQTKKDAYLDDLVPALTKDMNVRIDAYKAGETIIAQIRFLLGESTESEPPTDIDTTRFQLVFPDPADKGECSLSPLTDEQWIPVPVCKKAMLLDGCSREKTKLSGWGIPREENAGKRAGEATCCTKEGKAVRHIKADGTAALDPADPHKQCTTTSGARLFEGDTPSHTFFEAKALCDRAGLRLCRTQEELNTGCNTGCWLDTVLAWVE